MKKTKASSMALAALNYDLFEVEPTPPVPATLYTKIKNQLWRQSVADIKAWEANVDSLPAIEELYRMFNRYNWLYFDGKLPQVRIEYSTRMRIAGSYTPRKKLIRIGYRYHRIFPDEIVDTLKHEMIHIIYFKHNAAFKREAKRIGASLKARTHPSLMRSPRYIYYCPNCGKEYPRQKILRMVSCGDCSKGGKFDARYKLKLLKR